PHLAEQVAGLHQRDDALPSVDRVGDGDGDAPVHHDVQRVGRIALGEEGVAAHEVPLGASLGQHVQRGVVGVGEEVGTREHVSHAGVVLSHQRGGYYRDLVSDVGGAAAKQVWTVVVAGGGGQRFG